MAEREAIATYLEQRESDEAGEEAAGLSHSAAGLVLVHVQELAAYGEPVGGVTLLHTAGDHGGRYLAAGHALADAGWAVALPDLRGHGRSEGERGHSAGLMEVVRDLGAVQDHLAYRLPDAPKVLIGTGLGAIYAAAYARERPGSLAALGLVSPLFEPRFELPTEPRGAQETVRQGRPQLAWTHRLRRRGSHVGGGGAGRVARGRNDPRRDHAARRATGHRGRALGAAGPGRARRPGPGASTAPRTR